MIYSTTNADGENSLQQHSTLHVRQPHKPTDRRTLLSFGNRWVGNDDRADIGGLGNGTEMDDANASTADDADLDLLFFRSRVRHGEGRSGSEGGSR